MIEYIYFVKCPNCEDEPFSFFDEAQHYALGCLSNKPIITQVEVDRDDFGCCTDSHDLGTIWSYDEVMNKDLSTDEPTMFSKSETFGLSDEDIFKEFEDTDDDIVISVDDDTNVAVAVDDDSIDIKSLVEMMEENEDTVECKWCEDLFDKSECRYEVDLGYLCSRCEAAIKSRGETLTFRENNYWDFLDEDVNELAEAKINNYPFVYFRENPAEAKQAILDKLLQEYDIDFTRSRLPTVYYTNSGQMEILDFNVTPDGHIKIKARSTRSKDEYEEDLTDALDGLIRGSGRVLRAIRDIALDMKPDVRAMNAIRVMANIDTDLAKEFAKYISKITFRIPLIGISPYSKKFDTVKAGKYSSEDFLDISEEARDKLEYIYDSFMALPFINNDEGLVKSLVNEGIIKNRPSTEDTNKNIARRWWISAYITFKCPIKKLPKHILDTIYRVKGKDKRDMDDNEANEFETPNTVCSAHLASALIQRMDNDIKFYENADIEISYTTDDDKELATV